MTTPDPDPATTTGLEPGGGVPPGETPPGEASTVGPTQHQTPPGRGVSIIAITAIVFLILLVIGFLVVRAVIL